MKTRHLYCLALALVSPLLFLLAWPPSPFDYTIFFAIVPLFLLDKELSGKGKTGVFFGYLYLSLFLFNLFTTWWVWNASAGGAIGMLLANTLVMTFPFMAFRFVRHQIGVSRALIAFALFWLTFEFIHFRWDLAYPWLTLGNSFAKSTGIVQWFEYTGVLGGTLWILIVNILVFRLFDSTALYKRLSLFFVLLGPLFWSYYLGNQQNHCPANNEIVVVQPNIDPYEKFNSGGELDQVKLFLDLAEAQVTDHTELVVLPETAIVEYIDESYINSFESIRLFQQFIKSHKNLRVLTGAATYRFFDLENEPTKTARFHESSGRYYDSYNTALLIDSTGVVDIYHKSRLVPGTESIPSFLNFLKPLSIDLGGVSGSLGVDSVAHVFSYSERKSKLKPAALICYESVFGDYVTDFVNMDANILFVITNDGWWGQTPGHIHHLHYARLRAIESRRYVVRAANTGISSVIDDNGNILYRTKWWEAIAFKTKVRPLHYQTFYVRNGDYLGRIAAFLSLFLLLSVIVKKITKRE